MNTDVYEKYERRKPIICQSCGAEMLFAKDVMRSSQGRILYLKYICPCRKGEKGCGIVKWVGFRAESDARFRRTHNNIFMRI